MTFTHVLTPMALFRLGLGWASVLALVVLGPLLEPPLPAFGLITGLACIIAVIVVCSFGVVQQAERLAQRMGDPYGTLVLTLSIVMIEVILISAVMLGPGEHATIGRDSVMAVSMIIMNLVIGLCLLISGFRYGGLTPNRTGVSSYLALLVVLVAIAFALPGMIGHEGSYSPWQAIVLAGLTVVLYVFFLVRQMGPQASDFQEFAERHHDDDAAPGPTITQILSHYRAELGLRAVVLLATVVPIVLLSHDMASLLDDGLGRLGAPVALAGVVIAMIVFLPETLTAVRAAAGGEIQRVSNLNHGALVSTVGLTIPAVLLIGLVTDQTVVLAESPANLLLLGVTLLLTAVTFGGRTVTALHGAAHLTVFALYWVVLFS